MNETKVTISLRTILVIILVGLGLVLAYELRALILTVFFAYIINAGLRPIVDRLTSKGFKRGIAIALTYIVFFVIVFILGFSIISTAVIQLQAFINDLDTKILNLASFINTNLPFLNNYIHLDPNAVNVDDLIASFNIGDANQILVQFANIVGNQGLSIVNSVVNVVFSLVIIIMLSIYMLGQPDYVYKPLIKLLPERWEKRFDPVLDKIEASLGAWMGGQLILMLSVGIITYLILVIPGIFDPNFPLVKYALVLSIIAGLLEGIPNIGPIITMVVALAAAVLTGGGVPVLIYILISFVILQQLEGILIVPVVMKRALDLHPILSIVGAVAGLELAGPVGALLSIPIVATIQIVVLEVSKSYRQQKTAKKISKKS